MMAHKIIDLLVVFCGFLLIMLFLVIQSEISNHFSLSLNSAFFISFGIFCLLGLIITFMIYLRVVFKRASSEKELHLRRRFIFEYQFSEGLITQFSAHHLNLNNEEIQLVFKALKDYFYLCLKAPQQMISMPSQIVDEAWHDFILFTLDYQQFCQHAFGYFLHHTPSEAMKSPIQAQSGIQLAWRLACEKEGINIFEPSQLPLIFEIDSLLKIENGFYYSLNCLEQPEKKHNSSFSEYCITHLIETLTPDMVYNENHYTLSGEFINCHDSHHSCCSDGCGGHTSCGSGCGGSCGGGGD